MRGAIAVVSSWVGAAEIGRLGLERPDAAQELARRQQDGGLGVVEGRQELGEGPAAMAQRIRRRRDGQDPGIEAAHESGDEIEPCPVEQEGALARGASGQRCRDIPRRGVEFPPGQAGGLGLAVLQMQKGLALGLGAGARLQALRQGLEASDVGLDHSKDSPLCPYAKTQVIESRWERDTIC